MLRYSVRVASVTERANQWHEFEDGRQEYHIHPDATEFRVSEVLMGRDPRLLFQNGMSALNLETLSLDGAILETFPMEFMRCQRLTEIRCRNVGLYKLPNMFGNASFGLQRLTKLNCSMNNLKELPRSIGDLSNLKELDVSDNWLSTLPNEIWNLVNLEVLRVQDNVLIALPETGIQNMKKLEVIDCSNNKLTDSSDMPEGLLDLQALNLFCLYGNVNLPKLLICHGNFSSKHWELDMETGAITRITTNGRIEFTPCKYYVICTNMYPPLQSLKLSQCNLLFVPKRIMELESLRKLDLSNSSFCKLPDDIGKLVNLRTLDISNNDRLKKVPDDLRKCTKLKKVIVKDCTYCEDLLESLDEVLKDKSVKWRDRPPLIPKLIIKLLVCCALMAMSLHTIPLNLKEMRNRDCKIDSKDPKDVENVASCSFKYSVSALSIILLIPHAIDVGTMMDHFLQVPTKKKLHRVLDLQDKLADRIDFPTIIRHNFWGLLSSIANLFCFFWCTRPSDLENHLDEEADNMRKTKGKEKRCGLFPCLSRPWEHMERTAPLSLEVFCFSPIASIVRLFKTRVVLTKMEYFVIIVEWIDTVQTLMLFPLTVLIICSAETVNDVFVNVVAVSVFARLDDEAVELFTKPQASLVERWYLYTGSGDDLKRSGIIDIKGGESDESLDSYESSTRTGCINNTVELNCTSTTESSE